MNVIFVLMLNFDKSVVSDTHSFFKEYIYSAVPSLLNIPFTYYFDEIFKFLQTSEQFQNKIADMFQQAPRKSYTKAMIYFLIQICFLFFITSMFYIYMRETVNILLTINKRNKSNAGFAMFVTGLVVFYVLGVIIQQAMAKEGGSFMQKIMVFFFAGLAVVGIAYTYFTVLNKTYFRYIQSPSADGVAETTTSDVVKDKINNTMIFILNLGKELFFTCGKLIVGLVCVFLCLLVLFFIYDWFKRDTYRDYVDKKRKVFQSVCYILYSVLVGFYV